MIDIWNNSSLWVPVIVWFFVQSFKVIVELVKDKKINIKRMWGSGGMPSSHSAFVCSLATTVAIRDGINSSSFAISAILALVVMYDAAGVRRAAGKQARVLNQIIESDGKNINIQEKLIELLGHTPMEVYTGAIIGIILGLILINLW